MSETLDTHELTARTFAQNVLARNGRQVPEEFLGVVELLIAEGVSDAITFYEGMLDDDVTRPMSKELSNAFEKGWRAGISDASNMRRTE